MDAVEILEHLGVEVIYPQAQSCCGQPAYTSGYTDEARRVALAQINALTAQSPATDQLPIVALSGSCAGMMKLHYPTLFSQHPAKALAESVSTRIIEFTEFLLQLGVDLSDLFKASGNEPDAPEAVVIHTACSARRELGTHHITDDLLNTTSQFTAKEISNEEECCGFGGTFSIRQPEISAAMVEDKCNAIIASDPAHLISADCACLLNINGRLAKKNSQITGQHIASFLNNRRRKP